MLQTLYIENIAVIEKTSIDFNDGLNVLTGETGAGKSIIIDAINAIMGQRTSKDIIRTGAQSAFVSAQFDNINENVRQSLADLGFDDDEGTVIIQRTLSKSGKSSCKINGRPASVSMLKEAAKNLINIHGQHESYELFSPDTHIDYIDSFGGCEALLSEYEENYKKYRKIKKQLSEANADESERLREIDLLSYQCNELFEADIDEGEEDELENERKVLMSFEKISELLNRAKVSLEGDEEFSGGLDFVDNARNDIEKAASYNSEYEELSEELSNAYYGLRDCYETVCDAVESLEGDPERLDEVEQRLDLLNRLSRKYGCSCDELPKLALSFQNRLEQLQNYDRNREALEKAFKEVEKKCMKSAERLSTMRKKAAAEFTERVKKEMGFLNMPNVEIVVQFENTAFYEKGTDKVEFLISANPGETPRPVAKIASGGELSRMMLAIKTVLASTDSIDTLIFDEVDTGISGSAAEKVGLKLKEVSKSGQVLCVTHQAQIAALADYHYLIKKQVENGRTFTCVEPLGREGRIHELARIIGGVNITQAALQHAEDMLKI